LEFTANFVDYLSEKGYDPAYGARPIKRILQRELVNELAKALLENRIHRDDRIVVDIKDGKITL
jgi:ATP-dependent Clp protease ATP-binding subunit ClpB